MHVNAMAIKGGICMYGWTKMWWRVDVLVMNVTRAYLSGFQHYNPDTAYDLAAEHECRVEV
jgi:hypothetical protein